MSCGGCAASVKRILESEPQVQSATVNLATEMAVVWAVPEIRDAQDWKLHLRKKLANQLTTCGYKSNLRGKHNKIEEHVARNLSRQQSQQQAWLQKRRWGKNAYILLNTSDKERDSKAFLDMAGVKDRSKLVVVEDPEAKVRRLIERRRNGHLEKAAKAVAAVTAEVDKLAPKVAALDASVRKGEKVAENDVVQLTELLMNELLKLDAVVADGDVKAQRRMQVKRVQKYVETLDTVMVKNAAIVRKSGEKVAKQQQPASHHNQYQQQQPAAAQTRWEMFDLLSSLPSTSSASSTTTVSSTASSGAPAANKLDWMLF